MSRTKHIDQHAARRRAIAAVGLTTCLLAGAALALTDDESTVREQRIAVNGVRDIVEIEFDRWGVPTIRGRSFEDVVFGHGFVHAQDRFFQMDGARRLAAGEAAALAGPAVVDADIEARRFRFRHVAEQVVARLDDDERVILDHYTDGVNAAIEAMSTPPFVYQLLQVDPEPWTAADTVLVQLGMFDMLHTGGSIERRNGVMHDALPEELARFLMPRASRFDALLLPHVLRDGHLVNDWTPMPIPGPDVIDLRERAVLPTPDDIVEPAPLALGSNNWAVAGSRTHDGRAILANDPHLRYMVPGVWYRSVLEWDGGRAAGLSLPGSPGISIGANDHVAWGFTNFMGDFQDYIIVEVHPDDPARYRTPDGYEPFGEVVEEIEVRGRNAERLTLRTTRWGVVIDDDHAGRPLVLKWTALGPEMVNLHFLRIMSTTSIDDAVEVARSWFGPAQNVVMADADGRIAWVVSGYLPKRVGFDGTRPMSWAEGDVRWDGHIDETDRPMLVDPEPGILFTANNRTMPLEHAKRLGGIWTAGTRARRIGELLAQDRMFTERDLFAMQHDTRIAVFDQYREALFDAADRRVPDDDLINRGLKMLREWNGRADGDQPAVHVLDAYRRRLEERVIAPLVMPCRELDERFSYRSFMSDEVVLRLIEDRPPHFLPPGHDDWDDFVISVWRDVLIDLEQRTDAAPEGIETPWGDVNRLRMTHPLSTFMPFMAETLDMRGVPQPGHSHAVRVARPRFGASARLVVSPRALDEAILQTPAGQSGNPNSPHYRDLHDQWLHEHPTPLMPRETHRRLTLPHE